MSKILDKLYYSESHEWLRDEGEGIFALGITDHAQSAMGDMVYIDLPEVGGELAVNGECGVLESVKSASDIYSPVAGEIAAVNETLGNDPAAVNKDPYGEGWLLKIQVKDPAVVKELMDATAYKKFLEE